MAATMAGMLVAFVALASPAFALPDITLAKEAPGQLLYGNESPVTLTAANPAGSHGYNLSFRDVLPAGRRYVAGSARPSAAAGDPERAAQPARRR